MSYSQREKLRQHFRNNAIPRSKIPRHLQKYCKYKTEYGAPIVRPPPNRNNAQMEEKNEYDFVDMPHDIPSIEEHSDLLHPHIYAIREHEGEESSSSVEDYSDGEDTPELQRTDGLAYPHQMPPIIENTRTQPIPKVVQPTQPQVSQG